MDGALVGMSASPGVAIGPVHLLHWEVPDVPHRIIPDEQVAGELTRFRAAVERARERLHQLRARVAESAGENEAEIFDVQVALLADPDLIGEVEEFIHQNRGAEHAFDIVMLEKRRTFEKAPSAFLRERVGDLKDLHIRVLTLLLGLPDHDPVDVPKGASAILVTHDLTPSLTVQLDRDAIAGIATDAGTRTSHVAILARSLGLPAVVGLRGATLRLKGRERVILDGYAGRLLINPTDEEVEIYRARALREASEEEELRLLSDAEPVTVDGVRVTLLANVDLPEWADAAAHSGAEGVGLMRTEFLVVGRTTMPDEEEQYRAYRRVLEAFGSRPVIIRTFDIGGDKLPVGGFPSEANPALGWRAIRMCLDEPELFSVQLRALLRAAVHGDLRIMLPLVVTVDEVHRARELVEQAARDLAARGIAHRADVPLGVMVETPAAAVVADTLAGAVSFFSIGTNDLVQYTLAVDRGNANIATRFTPLHPAVLRLIQRTVEVAHEHGLEVGVCGEMASQPLMAFALLGLGVRQLSVAHRSIPLVKRIIRGISARIAAEAADVALRAPTASVAEDELRRRLLAAFGDAPFLRDGLPGPVERNIIRQLEPS